MTPEDKDIYIMCIYIYIYIYIYISQTLMQGKIEGRRRGGQEDEVVGWHHQLNGHELGQTPGDSEG